MKLKSRQLERPKSLTEMAEESIRQLIVSGDFAMGEQLSEASLALQLGISKTPVREALLKLRADGLIDIQPQRGTFVFSLTATQVDEICRFRELIEVAALGQAMQLRHTDLVAGLDENLRQMGKAQNARDWRAIPILDQEFHKLIIDHCENSYLQQSYELVASKIRALRSRLPEENESVGHCQENHSAIVRLICNSEMQTAQNALATHIRDTRDSYIQASGASLAA
ncbi:MAG: GntR family transcriptional regulator [Burkholderiales bacterium]|nr:GntR family transcriptional regulator [Burkholderiales bacterium]